MSRLKGHIAYLAGAIDKADDYGRGWRNNLTPFLHSLGMGVFDPCDKAVYNAKISEDKDFVEKINKLKIEGKYKEVQSAMKEVCRIDLNFVDLSNVTILNVVSDVHMCGSYGEQTIACMQRKPIIVHCRSGIHNIPNWLFGVCDPEMFFDNWNDVGHYLSHICYDEDVDDQDSKWRFINYDKVFGRPG